MLKTIEGPIMVRGKGTGFVTAEGFDEDIVIDRDSLGYAMDGDIVEIELKKKDPRQAARRQSCACRHLSLPRTYRHRKK